MLVLISDLDGVSLGYRCDNIYDSVMQAQDDVNEVSNYRTHYSLVIYGLF